MITENELAFLDSNKYLREHIGVFLEAFIKYYGTEESEELKSKFKNAIFVGYQDIEELQNYIDDLERKYTQEFLRKELKAEGLEDYQNVFFCDYSFEFSSIMPISLFIRYYELHLEGYENRKAAFINAGLENFKKVKPEATLEEYEKYIELGEIPHEPFIGQPKYLYMNATNYLNLSNADHNYERARDIFLNDEKNNLSEEEKKDFFASPKFQRYKSAYECFKRARKKYDALQEELRPFKTFIEKSLDLKDKLNKKHYKEFIKNCSFIFTEAELQEIEVYLNSTGYVTKPKCLKALSDQLCLPTTIGKFTLEAEEKLNNPQIDEWTKSNIMKERVEYFKSRGLDLGDDYEAYKNSPEAQAIWPSPETAKRVEEESEKAYNSFNIEYYTNTSRHQETRREIDSMGLIDKDDGFNAALYTLHGTAVCPNVVKVDDEIKLFPLVVIHVTDYNEYLDHTIVHELNHLYELFINFLNGNQIEYLCGWDYVNGELGEETKEIDTLHKDPSKRKYELFSEIINELIAQDISKIMLENGLHVFNTKENAQYRGYTSYEYTRFLVEKFFSEYQKEIIESRKLGRIEVIFNKVGKDNFDKLNNLIIEFRNRFPEPVLLSLKRNLEDGIDNEDTKAFAEFQVQRDTILDAMKTYSMKVQ